MQSLLLSIACVFTSVAFSQVSALKCIQADSVEDLALNMSVDCASYHTGCFEEFKADFVTQTQVYKAFCSKADHCSSAGEGCLYCSGDNCNNHLIKQYRAQAMQCYSYDGGVREETYGNEVVQVAEVKEQTIFCLPGVDQCHRVKTSMPDPGYASGFSKSANKITVKAACDRVDCRRFQYVADCLICSGSFCNSLSATSPPFGIQMSDEASKAAACISAARPLLSAIALAGILTRLAA